MANQYAVEYNYYFEALSIIIACILRVTATAVLLYPTFATIVPQWQGKCSLSMLTWHMRLSRNIIVFSEFSESIAAPFIRASYIYKHITKDRG